MCTYSYVRPAWRTFWTRTNISPTVSPSERHGCNYFTLETSSIFPQQDECRSGSTTRCVYRPDQQEEARHAGRAEVEAWLNGRPVRNTGLDEGYPLRVRFLGKLGAWHEDTQYPLVQRLLADVAL